MRDGINFTDFKLFPWERLFHLTWTAQYKLENFTWNESFDDLMLIWGALKFKASYLRVLKHEMKPETLAFI